MILTDLLPLVSTGWFYFYAFGFGVIIGSFLNVYIYRFHTGKSLSGSSHCLSCGTKLTWYELFPLVSFLVLRGKCRTCKCRIPSRYFLVELLTGVLFTVTVWFTLNIVEILFLWLVVSILVVVTVYDLYHFIIPDEFTALLTVVTTGWFGYLFFSEEVTLRLLLTDAAAALTGAGFFLFLWLVSKGAWVGFGDVKLAIPLGLLVGAPLVFSFIVLSFWVGAGISLLIMAFEKVRRGKDGLQLTQGALTMKSAVPFAPFLVAGCLITLFTNFNVLHLFA